MLLFIVLFVVKAKILPRRDTNERIKSFQNMLWSMTHFGLDSQALPIAHHLELLLTSSINDCVISSSGLYLRVRILSDCGFYPLLHSLSLMPAGTDSIRLWILSTAPFVEHNTCGYGFYPIVDSIHRSIRRA